jgi:hypothetical protein
MIGGAVISAVKNKASVANLNTKLTMRASCSFPSDDRSSRLYQPQRLGGIPGEPEWPLSLREF